MGIEIDRLAILTELCVENSVQFCGKESHVILLFADKLLEQQQAEIQELKKEVEFLTNEYASNEP